MARSKEASAAVASLQADLTDGPAPNNELTHGHAAARIGSDDTHTLRAENATAALNTWMEWTPPNLQ